MFKRALLLLLALAACLPCALAHTRQEVRQVWRAVETDTQTSPYQKMPSVSAPYSEGALTQSARTCALETLNFARWLAGLEPVEENPLYDDRCQRAAVLLAALDYVDHDAPRPEDMDADFYASAHLGTASGNIARFNWMRPTILKEGVEYFLRDDGEANLPTLGHRRWALNPDMQQTGFGLANSASGNSYVVMYAHDLEGSPGPWDIIAWPASGAFPAELMHTDLAWSIMLNPDVYNLAASQPVITLTEASAGLAFEFYPADGSGNGDCFVNYDGYGAGPCLIFRPDFSGTGFSDYQQNQRWTVKVDGLHTTSGDAAVVEYTVDMIALRAVDPASVEISALEASLSSGEQLTLSAVVFPEFADDTSVTWASSDETVAIVDSRGQVTALAPGQCLITATASNGRFDECSLSVEE